MYTDMNFTYINKVTNKIHMFVDKPWLFCYNFHPTSIHFLLKHFWYCNSLRFPERKMREILNGRDSRIRFFLNSFNDFAQLNGNTPVTKIGKWISFMRLNESNTRMFSAAHNYFIAYLKLFTIFSFNWMLAVFRSEILSVRNSNWFTRFFQDENNFFVVPLHGVVIAVQKMVLSYAFNVV